MAGLSRGGRLEPGLSQRPSDETRPSTSARRLTRLVGFARAADFWERLWRGLIPPLVVIGSFICLSWLGLWLVAPHWLRAGGVAVFAMSLAASSFGLWRLKPLGRSDALRRIDKASGIGHRPASALEDRLATLGRDPATGALWALHLRRAEAETLRLQAGRPSPRSVELDRYALRAGILIALVASAIVAGPQRYARIAAAFDFGSVPASGASYRLDAWIDPPPYTGRAPVLLDLASASVRDAAHPMKLAAPVGSTVIIRSSGSSAAEVETSGPLLPAPAKPQSPGEKADSAKAMEGPDAGAPSRELASSPGQTETKLVLHGDSKLVLRQGGSLRGTYEIAAVADQSPTISLREIPKINARGSLTLSYTTGDDYGVAAAEAVFTAPKLGGERTAGPSLVDPPKVQLALPGVTHGIGDGETTADLSDHPWAGAQVTMVLVAHDEGGNEGRSEPVEITLPQKPFTNPLARALVEQRRLLVLEPSKRADIGSSLAALMIEPEAFGTSTGAYLGLRYASDTLGSAQTKAELTAVADFLWGMALQLENGDLSDAERALRNAEKELRDAIERRAPDEEIQKLTQNLQTAMDRFLKELAEQQSKQDRQQADNKGRPSRSISPRDLQKLIDRLKEQARSGNREEAKKALNELQDILENLKTAKRQKADPQARAMAESLNQLDQMMRDQQDLRDDTYKQGQQPSQQSDGDRQRDADEGEDGEEQQMRRPGRTDRGQQGSRGQGSSNQTDQGSGSKDQNGQAQKGQGAGKSLGQRQRELSDRLAEIEKKLKQAGQGDRSLGEAGEDMHEAEEALRQGEGASGQAVDAQGRALDALQKGAKKLAEAMKQQGGDPNGQANSEGEGSQGSQEGQQSSDADPLGRPRGGTNTLNSMSRLNQLGVPAAQRAQRVLEELRRRLADPARSQEEIDYLERLLRSY